MLYIPGMTGEAEASHQVVYEEVVPPLCLSSTCLKELYYRSYAAFYLPNQSVGAAHTTI